jgi:hypothetical protein
MATATFGFVVAVVVAAGVLVRIVAGRTSDRSITLLEAGAHL